MYFWSLCGQLSQFKCYCSSNMMNFATTKNTLSASNHNYHYLLIVGGNMNTEALLKKTPLNSYVARVISCRG